MQNDSRQTFAQYNGSKFDAKSSTKNRFRQPCQVHKTPKVVKKRIDMYTYINDQKINMKFMSVIFGILDEPKMYHLMLCLL
jgi:hypothetical protein